MNTRDQIIIWAARPSQLENLGSFVLSIAAILAAPFLLELAESHLPSIPFPIAIAAAVLPMTLAVIRTCYRVLITRSTLYILSGTEISLERGILTKRLEKIDAFRIVDASAEKPFIANALGSFGNVRVFADDRTSPMMKIRWVKDPYAVAEVIKSASESDRRRQPMRAFVD